MTDTTTVDFVSDATTVNFVDEDATIVDFSSDFTVIEIGELGPPGPGVPVGGDDGQVLAKASDVDYDTEWVDQSGGIGGHQSILYDATTDTPSLIADNNQLVIADNTVDFLSHGALAHAGFIFLAHQMPTWFDPAVAAWDDAGWFAFDYAPDNSYVTQHWGYEAAQGAWIRTGEAYNQLGLIPTVGQTDPVFGVWAPGFTGVEDALTFIEADGTLWVTNEIGFGKFTSDGFLYSGGPDSGRTWFAEQSTLWSDKGWMQFNLSDTAGPNVIIGAGDGTVGFQFQQFIAIDSSYGFTLAYDISGATAGLAGYGFNPDQFYLTGRAAPGQTDEPLLDLNFTDGSALLRIAPNGKINGVAPSTGSAVVWDGAKFNYIASPLARGNHTGTQSADTLTDGTTNKAFLATERTKLAGIATAATANSSDATLLARANHTGTQLAATISDFSAAVTAVSATAQKRVVRVVLDGGGSAITTGAKKVYVTVPYTGTITAWQILADVSGSIVLDVWKDTYANYPPTVADTVTASAKPTLTTATKATSSTLTGWTTAITAGDIIEVNVDSATTVTKVYLDLFVTVT